MTTYGWSPSTSASSTSATAGGAPARSVLDLAGQPGAARRVVRDVRAQHLDGHRAAARVERQVDDAHAALAEPLRPAGTARCAVRCGVALLGPAAPGARRRVRTRGPVVRAMPLRYARGGEPGPRDGPAARSLVLLDVADQLVALGLQLVDALLDDVADADDAVQPPSTDHGDVADARSVILRASSPMCVCGSQVATSLVMISETGPSQDGGPVAVELADDVALADDAVHGLAVRADHAGRRSGARRAGRAASSTVSSGRTVTTSAALAADHVCDPHARR